LKSSILKYTLLLYLIIIQSTATSQNATNNKGSVLQQFEYYDQQTEKIFLHLDRNLYQPGDTILFQAYIRNHQTGIFETKSISLFSLLLDQAHKMIDSARFRIINSTASGWLKIPNTIPFGNYTVIAFSSMQMNYDPEFVFSAPIRIGDPRLEQEKSDLIIRKEPLKLDQIPLTQDDIDLRFLPEGGTLIYDLTQRIAFNAVTSGGKNLQVTGEIINQKGEFIADFSSGRFGPGIIDLTPLYGDTYYATLKGEDFLGMIWPLPVPEKSGIAIRVNKYEKGIIDVLLQGKGVKGKTYSIVLSVSGVPVVSQSFKIDSIYKLRIQTEALPAGTAFITLYDNDLGPVAERLVFINEHKKLNIDISSSSSVVNRGDESELILNITDDTGNNLCSIISISVVDSTSGYYKDLPHTDIESAFLYDRVFLNNLPLRIKLYGLSKIDNDTIDLLLMTYGWRKFNLKPDSEIHPPIAIMDYDQIIISNPGSLKNGRSEITLTSLERSDIISLPVNINREAILPFDTLNSYVRQVMILPDKKHRNNINPVTIIFPTNQDFIDRVKRLDFEYDFNLPNTNIHLTKKEELLFSLDTIIILDGVTILGKGRRNPTYVNKIEDLYRYAKTKTLTSSDFEGCIYFEDILRRYNPYYINTIEKYVILRPVIASFRKGANPALFVLNDVPIGLGYGSIDRIPASQIASVTILKGSQGYTLYRALGGIIFVNTKTERPLNQDLIPQNDQNKKKNDLMRPVRIFRTEIEYYVPTKEEVAYKPELQGRSTILWKNEILLDGKGPAKIKYPNNINPGTVMVTVNGVSITNNVGSKSFKYFVK